jgi:lipoprotein-anchoring transpeptidase ErfK/SrfK
MKRASVMLPALAAGLMLAAGAAQAQIGATTDADAAQKTPEQIEAEREARRASRPPVIYPKFMNGGEQPDIQPAEPPIVYFDQAEEPGSIIVDTENRKLFFVLPGKKAYAYPISVGREGFTWSGTEKISRIASWPSWTPPPEMHKRIPGLPITVSGGMRNPQGARALYLGNTIYRIHGTNNDRTVGRANSSGCFRLRNEHVVHLATIAKVGTKVKVLKAYGGTVSETAPIASLWSWGNAEQPKAEPAKAQSKKAKDAKPAAKKPAPVAAKTAASAAAPAKAATEPAASRAITAAPEAAAAPTAAADAVAAAKAAAADAAAAAKAAREAADAAKKAAAAVTPAKSAATE